MKYDKGLIDEIKKRNFKTFWHCLDFLLLAGYSPIDAFGVSLLEFGESRIYSDVAFIRAHYTGKKVNGSPYVITVGLMDENNSHLAGLYNIYRKWRGNLDSISLPNKDIEDIEASCEVIKVSGLSLLILKHLSDLSGTHFGFVAFELPPNDDYEGEYTEDVEAPTGVPMAPIRPLDEPRRDFDEQMIERIRRIQEENESRKINRDYDAHKEYSYRHKLLEKARRERLKSEFR